MAIEATFLQNPGFLFILDHNEKLLWSACCCGRLDDTLSALNNGADPDWRDEVSQSLISNDLQLPSVY